MIAIVQEHGWIGSHQRTFDPLGQLLPISPAGKRLGLLGDGDLGKRVNEQARSPTDGAHELAMLALWQ